MGRERIARGCKQGLEKKESGVELTRMAGQVISDSPRTQLGCTASISSVQRLQSNRMGQAGTGTR